MSRDPRSSLAIFRSVFQLAELGEWTSGKLAGIRTVSESDRQTLERVLEQARKTICGHCWGTGRSRVMTGKPCRHCHGLGEKAYDPHMPVVKEVMES